MNFKNLKKEARKDVKNGYFKNLIVVFVCSILISGGLYYSTKNILDVDVSKEENAKLVNSFNTKTNGEVLDDLLEKSVEDKEIEKYVANKYTRGFLSSFVNEVTQTKSITFSIVNSVNTFIKGHFSVAIIILISNIILFILRTFYITVLEIGRSRYFLEQRRYLETKMDRILYPYKKRRNFRLAVILLLRDLYLILWSFTIVGVFIKYYEYSMLPFILAENPKIKRKDAFKLSKELTKGHKFELFKLDLSILGWKILGIFTFNLLNIFYTNIYEQTLHCEFYAEVREENFGSLTNSSLLNDEKLYIPDRINEAYPEDSKKKYLTSLDYDKSYSLSSYILFFFAFSIAGWCWEVLLHIVDEGTFVNRGTLYGPWLPIYGCGGVAILFCLKKLRKHPVKLFIASVILCGIVEYTGAWYLETFKHLKYWDYTGYFLNLQGRICAEGLIFFGLGGCGFTYIFAPLLDNLYSRINIVIKRILCVCLLAIFLVDLSYSTFVQPNTGKGISSEVK